MYCVMLSVQSVMQCVYSCHPECVVFHADCIVCRVQCVIYCYKMCNAKGGVCPEK